MKRILPEQVVEAYHATSLKPIRGSFFDEEFGLACAIGALACEDPDFDREKGMFSVYVQDMFDLTSSYVAGFMAGFDTDINIEDVLQPEMAQGYRDGKAAWKAVKEEFL